MFKNKKSHDYFDSFHKFSLYAIDAAQYLDEVINDYDVDTLIHKMDGMHKIESDCDIHHHAVNAELLSEFLPVIDAEDILSLNDALDDVVDKIEDILIGLYTFNVSNVRVQAIEFSSVIVKLSLALSEATSELKNYKSSKKLMEKIKAVNLLEQEADDIYIREMHRLHSEEDNMKKLMMWSRVYDLFEECADSFERVSKLMDMIVLKYN